MKIGLRMLTKIRTNQVVLMRQRLAANRRQNEARGNPPLVKKPRRELSLGNPGTAYHAGYARENSVLKIYGKSYLGVVEPYDIQDEPLQWWFRGYDENPEYGDCDVTDLME